MSSYYEVIDEQTKAGKYEPRRNQRYTLRQIYNDLALADSPCLLFHWNKRDHNIQTAHMDQVMRAKWLEGPAGDRLFRYTETTSEWVPVFRYDDERPLRDFLDAEREMPMYKGDEPEGRLWATPAGFPRKQYQCEKEPVSLLLNHRGPIPVDEDTPLARAYWQHLCKHCGLSPCNCKGICDGCGRTYRECNKDDAC